MKASELIDRLSMLSADEEVYILYGAGPSPEIDLYEKLIPEGSPVGGRLVWVLE